MTSNAGEEHIRAMCQSQEEPIESGVLLDNFRPQLLRYFKPAFLGRATVIPYYRLSDDDLWHICAINRKKIGERLHDSIAATFIYYYIVLFHIYVLRRELNTNAN